ncbi:MAG: S41 family peptidase [Chloroflexota bacterium]|nr:S41 family peptidase [Chloroflexota bacterium]
MPRVLLFRRLLFAGLAAACLLGGYALGLRDAGGIARLRPPAPAQLSAEDQRAFGVVWETLAQLERSYYRRDELNADTLAAAAARGMVAAVGDPYTSLTSAQASDLTTAQLRGSFDGVGLELDLRDGQLAVVSPLAGSPADRAGIQPGDLIATIDGASTAQLGLDEVAGRIRGLRGTPVTFGLQRSGSSVDVVVVRDTITVESVRSRLLPGETPLAYVRISMFSELTNQQLREQLAALLAQGSQGVVLDVRGNPGGYLTAAVDVASDFLKDGVVLIQDRGGSDTARQAYRTTGRPQAASLPIAVLVDRGSASAAEIVAAALRDNQRAVLIGEQSFGKGTVQEVHKLSDASQLRVTVAQWLTPNGHAIQDQGLTPDIQAPAVEGRDAPLDAAVQYLLHGSAHG